MAWVALGKEATTGAGWPAKGCLEDLAPDSPLQLSSEREGQAETHPHSPPHPSPRETWRVGWNPPTSGSALCENDAITTLKSYPCGAFARSSSPVSHFQTTWDAALNCKHISYPRAHPGLPGETCLSRVHHVLVCGQVNTQEPQI